MAQTRAHRHERDALGTRWRHFNPEGCTLCGSQLHTPTECDKINDALPSDAPVVHPPTVRVRVLPPGFSYLAMREARVKRPTALALGQVWTSAAGLVYYVDRLSRGYVTLLRFGMGERARICLRTRLSADKLLRDKSWRFVRQAPSVPRLP